MFLLFLLMMMNRALMVYFIEVFFFFFLYLLSTLYTSPFEKCFTNEILLKWISIWVPAQTLGTNGKSTFNSVNLEIM